VYTERPSRVPGAVLWQRTVQATEPQRVLPDGCLDLIWSGGTLLVAGNEAFGNNRGIIIEEIEPAATVVVRENHAHDNTIEGFAPTPTGIFLNNSDGSRFARNRVTDNGDYGFHVSADSEDNVFVGNRALRNPDENFFDEGSGSCGSQNSFPVPSC